MTDWQIQQRAASGIKATFPAGTRVRINHIADSSYHPDAIGQTGTVNYVDDMGQINISLDNGSSCTVCKHYGDQLTKL